MLSKHFYVEIIRWLGVDDLKFGTFFEFVILIAVKLFNFLCFIDGS